jgi:hypothetical protein
MNRNYRRNHTYHTRILVLVFAVFAVTSCSQPPKIQLTASQGRITKGPCLLRVYQDRAALMWETDVEGQWGVSCGTPGKHDRFFVSAAEKVTYGGKSADGGSKVAYIHKVWLENLSPGRTYAYRIVGPDVRSDVYRFRTTPARTDEVRFIVYGDSRTQADIHRRLVQQMMKYDVAFVVNDGDLVSTGDNYSLWGPQFFEPLKGLAERVPIYVAKGNHEGRGGNYEKLLVPPGEQNNFEFDYGLVHYFCMDNVSSVTGGDRLVLKAVEDARASKAPWKFVSYHVPSVNFGGHWSDWQQNNALPAFAEAGIDFIVTGHSHQYERFRPIELPGQAGTCITCITAGGGGAPLYPVEPTDCHAYAQAVYHFCLFHIKGNTLTMTAIDPNGRVFDRLQITKTQGRLDEQYRSTAVPFGDIQLHQALHKGMQVTLSDTPQVGQPCTMKFDIVVPPLSDDARLVFELHGSPEAYRLPSPYTAEVSREGGTIHVEFQVTLTVPIDMSKAKPGKAGPIQPPLQIDCRYEFASAKQTVSCPVMIMGK